MDQHVLCQIDALVDTRLPSLARVNPEAAAKMVNEYYWQRLSDDFAKYTGGMVTNEAYQAQYAKRDVDTLRGSLCTNLCLSLTSMFANLCDQRINSPLVHDVKLTINFYPYHLDDDQIEMYLTSLAVFTNNEVKLDHVWMAPDEITPALLDADYSAYILYDFDEWMGLQEARFHNKVIPSITVFAPARSAVGDFTEEDITLPGIGIVSPFEMLEFTSKLYVNLQLLDIAQFSPVR
jgi:hypothetical protein